MTDSKYVNGNLISGASCTLKINGQIIYGWEEISWEDKREREKGAPAERGGPPRGQSAGNYVAGPVKLKVTVDTALTIKEQLAALSPSGQSYGFSRVPMILEQSESGMKPITTTFHECTCAGVMPSYSKKDASVSMQEFSFGTMKIDENGLVLHDTEDDS